MKKIIAIILLLVLLIGIFAYSIVYKNNKEQALTTDISTTTVSADDGSLSDGDLIAQSAEGGYKLYYKNGVATVTYGDAYLTFTGWNQSIELQTPELYYGDFDGDSENELIIRLIDSYEEILGTTQYSYALYLIKPSEENGETTLSYATASSSTWSNVFSNSIKFEVTQLSSCKKILQFALNDADESINYDESTGITDNEYVSYALADCSDSKEYYTLSGFSYGIGVYNVSDDDITLDIQIIGQYSETDDDSLLGNIHCDIIIQNGSFKISPNSISFVPLEEKTVNDPRNSADSSWSYTITNLSAGDSGSDTVETLDDSFTVGSGSSSSQYFGSYTGGIKNIDTVVITESSITLTAKDGCTISSEPLENGLFEVLADDIDISYTAEISGNSLIITFDKAYTRDELSRITVNFGV